MNERYDVKIEIETYGSKMRDVAYLSNTHNGNTWASIRIMEPQHEVPRMIKVLQEYLEKVKERGKGE